MAFSKVFIPYGAYWSSPFCRWQGGLSGVHSLKLAAQVAAATLKEKGISAEAFDGLDVGFTVPQQHAFYGAPWVAALIGNPGISGVNISQACATSARLLAHGALEVEAGNRKAVLSIACDRTSNGPHIYYPDQNAPGARGKSEDWVWDNFNFDPYGKVPMITTAENVAKEAGISRQEQDQMTLLRYEQYQDALADDRAFQKRYMSTVALGRGKRQKLITDDEGGHPTTAEGLAKLKPVVEGGSVTFGSQTFPADGNAAMVFCDKAQADKLSADKSISIQVLSYGMARTQKAYMAKAVVPAAQEALSRAGVAIADCRAIKTHNPFAVNDVYFCNEMNVKPEAMNHYGSPLIWGHPQGPTGFRAMIEMIEELVITGGGYGLFAGCAAGDTAMATLLKVDCA